MSSMGPEETTKRHKVYEETVAAMEFKPWTPHESIPSGTPVKVHILSKTYDGIQVRDVIAGSVGPVLRIVKVKAMSRDEQITVGCDRVERISTSEVIDEKETA